MGSEGAPRSATGPRAGRDITVRGVLVTCAEPGALPEPEVSEIYYKSCMTRLSSELTPPRMWSLRGDAQGAPSPTIIANAVFRLHSGTHVSFDLQSPHNPKGYHVLGGGGGSGSQYRQGFSRSTDP